MKKDKYYEIAEKMYTESLMKSILEVSVLLMMR